MLTCETVSADAAGQLDPDVISNIGTIEIVVLRCQEPDEQFTIPARVTKPAIAANSQQNSKGKAKVTPKAPSVQGSDNGGSVGGMFNLSGDGAYDEPEYSGPLICIERFKSNRC